MSLKVYLDDCIASRELARSLHAAGHDVQIPADVTPSLAGGPDEEHLSHARAVGRVLLTFNAKDFRKLHQNRPDHPGILVVYRDNNLRKDMLHSEIVRAIANLESTGVTLAGGFWSLNAYCW